MCLSATARLYSHLLVALNLAYMFDGDSALCSAEDTHWANTCFVAPRPLFLNVYASLYLLNAFLNRPNTLRSNGCKA